MTTHGDRPLHFAHRVKTFPHATNLFHGYFSQEHVTKLGFLTCRISSPFGVHYVKKLLVHSRGHNEY